MDLANPEQVEQEDCGEFQFGEKAAHVVEFHLGSEHCAIDIDLVDGIVEMKQITRVPRAPRAVDGVIDLRGETTAVVDPKEFLAVEDEGGTANILVLDREGDKQKIGLRVDDVTEVATYRDSQVDDVSQLDGVSSSAIESEIIKGIIRKSMGETDEDGNPEEVSLILWIDVGVLIDAAAEDRAVEGAQNERDADTHS